MYEQRGRIDGDYFCRFFIKWRRGGIVILKYLEYKIFENRIQYQKWVVDFYCNILVGDDGISFGGDEQCLVLIFLRNSQ